MTVIRIQLAGQDFNPITLAPFLRGEKGDKGDPGDSAVEISTDPENSARLGSDGKIFVPAQSGMGAESDILLAIVRDVVPLLN